MASRSGASKTSAFPNEIWERGRLPRHCEGVQRPKQSSGGGGGDCFPCLPAGRASLAMTVERRAHTPVSLRGASPRATKQSCGGGGGDCFPCLPAGRAARAMTAKPLCCSRASMPRWPSAPWSAYPFPPVSPRRRRLQVAFPTIHCVDDTSTRQSHAPKRSLLPGTRPESTLLSRLSSDRQNQSSAFVMIHFACAVSKSFDPLHAAPKRGAGPPRSPFAAGLSPRRML